MLCHRQLKPSSFLGLFMRWGGFASALNKTAWTSTRVVPLQSMIENTETSIDNDKYFSFWNSHSSTLLLDTLLGVTAYGRAWAFYATQSESCLIWLHGSASWSTSCAHRMHLFFGKMQLLCFCIPEKSAAECELCLLTCSLDLRLSPQGFHDQPGVEPQRLLSAQCRHHLLQPITVQLDDLQVETGSQGLQSPQSPPSSFALTFNTEANSPPALPHRLWTLFLLHSQSLWNWSMLAQTEDKEF